MQGTAGDSARPHDETAGISRRRFLGSTAVGGAVVAGVALDPSGVARAAGPDAEVAGSSGAAGVVDETGGEVDSTFFSTVFLEEAGSVAATTSDGDLWPNCWADDDSVYAANGDGRGFSDEPFKDVVVNRIDGTPETGLTGEKLAEADEVGTIWGDPSQYNRKPTGMVCVGGVLYLAIQDLKSGTNAFDDVPNASISRSDDHGHTWQKTSAPMFTEHRFTTIFFLDFGKNSEHAVPTLGRRDGGYVYAYGMDWNWRTSNAGTVPDPVDLYLARVPQAAVQDRSKWEFFTGTDRRGVPGWSVRIEDKVPTLHDPLRRYLDLRPGNSGNLTVVSQGGVIYSPAFDRYLYTSWTDPSFEFYESPTPWGPWKRFLFHNEGLVPWYRMNDTVHTPKNGGYGTTIPAKFVSADGRDMWVQSNWWNAPVPTPADNYNFNLRRLRLTPWRGQTPATPGAGDNLARTGADVTTIRTCVHFANWKYLSDGDKTRSEDSFDGTNKLVDFWGYSFSRPYRMDRVVYTTGTMFPDGGWFSPYGGGLRVQVRQGFRWVDVDRLKITPDYPYGPTAGDTTTYTMRFATTWGEGVRIIGQPGGDAHFTSVAELEVYLGG